MSNIMTHENLSHSVLNNVFDKIDERGKKEKEKVKKAYECIVEYYGCIAKYPELMKNLNLIDVRTVQNSSEDKILEFPEYDDRVVKNSNYHQSKQSKISFEEDGSFSISEKELPLFLEENFLDLQKIKTDATQKGRFGEVVVLDYLRNKSIFCEDKNDSYEKRGNIDIVYSLKGVIYTCDVKCTTHKQYPYEENKLKTSKVDTYAEVRIKTIDTANGIKGTVMFVTNNSLKEEFNRWNTADRFEKNKIILVSSFQNKELLHFRNDIYTPDLLSLHSDTIESNIEVKIVLVNNSFYIENISTGEKWKIFNNSGQNKNSLRMQSNTIGDLSSHNIIKLFSGEKVKSSLGKTVSLASIQDAQILNMFKTVYDDKIKKLL